MIRLSPFYTSVGACLYTWNEDGRTLTKGPFDFRIVGSPKLAPDAFSSYQVNRVIMSLFIRVWEEDHTLIIILVALF